MNTLDAVKWNTYYIQSLCDAGIDNELTFFLSLNLGKNSLFDLHEWQEGLRLMNNNIDWTKAELKYTHFDNGKRAFCNEGGFLRDNGGYFKFTDNQGNVGWGTDRYIARPVEAEVEAPIYTQAMFDHNIKPKVGMTCAFDSTFFTLESSNHGICTIIAYHEDKVWLANGDFDCVINLSAITFKPIYTHTEKEIFIDAFMSKHLKGGIAFKHLISIAYDELVGDKS